MNFFNFILIGIFPSIAYGANGKGQFGLIVAAIVVLWIVVFGSNDSKVYLLKLISVMALVVGYAFFLFEVGQHFQLQLTPNKHIGLVSILIFVIGWFFPIVVYAKLSDKNLK
jgi:hypothetical protein